MPGHGNMEINIYFSLDVGLYRGASVYLTQNDDSQAKKDTEETLPGAGWSVQSCTRRGGSELSSDRLHFRNSKSPSDWS